MKVVCRVLTLGVTADRPGVSMKILNGGAVVADFESGLHVWWSMKILSKAVCLRRFVACLCLVAVYILTARDTTPDPRCVTAAPFRRFPIHWS